MQTGFGYFDIDNPTNPQGAVIMGIHGKTILNVYCSILLIHPGASSSSGRFKIYDGVRIKGQVRQGTTTPEVIFNPPAAE